MAVDKFRIHFLYLPEKRLSLKACIFGSKQMAFVYLAFFDDGTAIPYLPILPRDYKEISFVCLFKVGRFSGIAEYGWDCLPLCKKESTRIRGISFPHAPSHLYDKPVGKWGATKRRAGTS